MLGGAAASAHDFWIEPSAFRCKPDEPLRLVLRVGDHFQGDPVPRDSRRIVKFFAAFGQAELPISGRDGVSPAGMLRPRVPGLYMLAYRSNTAAVQLEGAKFEDYLKEKGLERVIEVRKQRGESATAAHEIYSRCSKSLVLVGDPPGEAADREIGLTLELIAERNPYTLKPGDELPVRLLYQGKPLENALLAGRGKAAPDKPQLVRTDSEGRAKVKLDHAGQWLLAAVHMIEAPKDSGAEWESLWASLTFEVPSTK